MRGGRAVAPYLAGHERPVTPRGADTESGPNAPDPSELGPRLFGPRSLVGCGPSSEESGAFGPDSVSGELGAREDPGLEALEGGRVGLRLVGGRHVLLVLEGQAQSPQELARRWIAGGDHGAVDAAGGHALRRVQREARLLLRRPV